jgi:hypothetical protein
VRIQWCWRCKADVPMLDEAEFASVRELYQAGFKATKDFRQQWGIPLEGASIEDRFRPVSLRYEEVTGMKDCPPNAVMHHRLSLYGPPCKRCEKPLRSPSAKLCGACMYPVD